MLDVLHEDYVRTARAKGLRELVVYMRHAFRPASIPVVTVIGASMASLATGFVVTESIFAIPGTRQNAHRSNHPARLPHHSGYDDGSWLPHTCS